MLIENQVIITSGDTDIAKKYVVEKLYVRYSFNYNVDASRITERLHLVRFKNGETHWLRQLPFDDFDIVTDEYAFRFLQNEELMVTPYGE